MCLPSYVHVCAMGITHKGRIPWRKNEKEKEESTSSSVGSMFVRQARISKFKPQNLHKKENRWAWLFICNLSPRKRKIDGFSMFSNQPA